MEYYRNHLEQSKAAEQKFIRANLRGWVRTTWSDAGLIMRARTFSRSCLLRNYKHKVASTENSWTDISKNSFLIPSLSFPHVTNTAQKQTHFLHWRSFPGLCSLKSEDELWDCSIPGAGLCICLCFVLPWNSCWSIYPSKWQMGSLAYSYLCSHCTSGFYTLPASTCSLVQRGRI